MQELLAQTNITINPQGQFASFKGGLTLTSVVSALITIVLVVAAVVFFFMLVIGGLRWILSGGDKAQTEAARNQITAAIIGLVVVFAAFAIAAVIQGLFGIDVFNLTLPSFLNNKQGGSGGIS